MREFEYATHWRDSVSGPIGIKARAGSLLRHATLDMLGFVDRLSRSGDSDGGRFLRCLYCHYVFDDQTDRFDRIIGSLKGLGTFVDTPTCLAILDGRRPLDRAYFHLSFDDGFRNLLTNALPVLRRHGVPAVFFVPTSLIGADWEAAKDYCQVKIHHRGVVEMLSWHDVGEIAAAGYEIGSHTRTHARFSAISGNRVVLEDEIAGSKAEIERKLGIACRSISWPYGRTSDADAASLAMVQSAGYEACFGAFRGSVVPGRTSAHCIPRHHFEVQWPVSHVRYFARGNWEHAA